MLDSGYQEEGIWVPIDELMVMYDADDRGCKLLTEITGSWPYPAHKDPLVDLARIMMEGGDVTKSQRARFHEGMGTLANLDWDVRLLRRRIGMPIRNWSPLYARRVADPICCEKPVTWKWHVYDGGHRIAMAIVLGHEKLRVAEKGLIKIADRHIYGGARPYQTLIFPRCLERGERGLERWPFYRREDIIGKSIVDLGCSSGTDGILALLAGAREYTGVEQDGQAIAYGTLMAECWNLQARFTIIQAPLSKAMSRLAHVDTLFLLSVARRIPGPDLIAAVARVAAPVIYCEGHGVEVDEITLGLMDGLPYEWEEIGKVPAFAESYLQRTLYRGVRKTG
jgi:hypothetical protein